MTDCIFTWRIGGENVVGYLEEADELRKQCCAIGPCVAPYRDAYLITTPLNEAAKHSTGDLQRRWKLMEESLEKSQHIKEEAGDAGYTKSLILPGGIRRILNISFLLQARGEDLSFQPLESSYHSQMKTGAY